MPLTLIVAIVSLLSRLVALARVVFDPPNANGQNYLVSLLYLYRVLPRIINLQRQF